nr:CMF_HP1_G0042510.mRNA.1.CDS.1 [Saccharomyces cerevisiae]
MCIAIKELIDQSVSRDDPRYLEIETLVKDTLNKPISNNTSQNPYGLKELTLLSSGPNLRGHLTQFPYKKWGNILGVNEFEIVTHHLRNVLTNEVSNLRRLDIEYVKKKWWRKMSISRDKQNYKEDVLIKHNHTNTHI